MILLDSGVGLWQNEKHLKTFLKGQSLFDVHQQYLQTFLIDLQLKFRFFAYFLKT